MGNFFAQIFMCHQRADRSFYYKGKKFPLCARCTGVLIGIPLGILSNVFLGFSPWALLLLLPMTIDGIVQHKWGKESNNIRRLWTGILGGIGMIYVPVAIHLGTLFWVRALLEKLNFI